MKPTPGHEGKVPSKRSKDLYPHADLVLPFSEDPYPQNSTFRHPHFATQNCVKSLTHIIIPSRFLEKRYFQKLDRLLHNLSRIIFVSVIARFLVKVGKTCTSDFFKDLTSFSQIAQEIMVLLMNNINMTKLCKTGPTLNNCQYFNNEKPFVKTTEVKQ